MSRHAGSRETVRKAITGPGGAVEAQLLRALHAGETVPGDALSEWAARVRADATSLTDAHHDALKQAGLDEAAVVAVTVASSVGEADRKLAVVEALRARRKAAKR